MIGTILYNDPAEAMDNMRFKISISSDYQPRLHPHYTENGIAPPVAPNEDCISIMTITELVKAIDSGVRVSIFEPEKNIPRIHGVLRAFMSQIDEIKGKVTFDDETSAFIDMINDVMNKLEPFYKRYLPEEEPIKNIHTVLGHGK